MILSTLIESLTNRRKKMKNVHKEAREFAKENDRLIFRFDITTASGAEGEAVGSIRREDADEAVKLWHKMVELMRK